MELIVNSATNYHSSLYIDIKSGSVFSTRDYYHITMDKIKLRSLIIFCRILWRVFSVENILHMFDKYQKYFRLSVCILVQTFCKCQTACVICDIWHWDDLWCLKYFLATLVMFILMSWPPPDTWHRFKNVFCKVNATQRSQDAFLSAKFCWLMSRHRSQNSP